LQDTSVIAQLGWPDMRLPLLYAISWPARVPMPWKPLDLAAIGTLTFKAPDHNKYPCIPLAYAAGRTGKRKMKGEKTKVYSALLHFSFYECMLMLLYPIAALLFHFIFMVFHQLNTHYYYYLLHYENIYTLKLNTGGSMTACLNAANERANELFRGEKLGYLGIPKAVEMVMEKHKADLMLSPSLEDIVNVDVWARDAVDSVLPSVNKEFFINL
jgi:1-deoxy-D-xylulose 5-phosphate reductoisomerase